MGKEAEILAKFPLKASGIRVLRDGAISLYIDSLESIAVDGESWHTHRTWVALEEAPQLATEILDCCAPVRCGGAGWSVWIKEDGTVSLESKLGKLDLSAETAQAVGLALIQSACRAKRASGK